MTTGVFISIEGIDGSGKGTQILALQDRLARCSDREVVCTRTPGGTPFGQQLRQLLVDQPDGSGLYLWTEFYLFIADMVETGQQIIQPALDRGAVVISDRFWHSTLVYQDYRRHGKFQRFPTLELPSQIPELLTPDRTILLDLPVATAAARTQQRGVVNHYDTEALGRRQRVRDGFLALAAHARASSGRIQVVDASLTPHAVERSVWASVQELL